MTITYNQIMKDSVTTTAEVSHDYPALHAHVASVETKPTDDGQPVGIKGVLIIEGTPTGDERKIASNALRWEEGPWTLNAQLDTPEMNPHGNATLVGRIDTLERVGNDIVFTGVLDGERGGEVARLVRENMLRGISADLDDYTVEIQTEDGKVIEDMDGLIEAEQSESKVLMVLTDARVRGGTITPMPAFVDTTLEITNATEPVAASASDELSSEAAASIASAMTSIECEKFPSAEWFSDPEFDEVTDLTIEDDRHLYGHIALWGTCHIGINGVCMLPPKSMSNYRQFLRHSVKTWCDDCGRAELKSSGPLTAPPGHAPQGRGTTAQQVRGHYDDIKFGFADVAVGEDEFGIWINGRIRDSATEQQIENFRASGLSGDWRRIDGALELVAVMAVNTPGYPIVTSPKAHVASGVQDSLISMPRYFQRDETLRERVEGLTSVISDLLTDKMHA